MVRPVIIWGAAEVPAAGAGALALCEKLALPRMPARLRKGEKAALLPKDVESLLI